MQPAALRPVVVLSEDESLRDIVTTTLKDAGVLVFAAANQDEAVHFAHVIHIDLIVFDLPKYSQAPEAAESFWEVVHALFAKLQGSYNSERLAIGILDQQWRIADVRQSDYFWRVLPKPADLNKLVEAVQERLSLQ